MYDDDDDIEDNNNNIEERIKELEKQRSEELDSRRWMASCPERTNSYGKYEFFEKKVNEKYDKIIGPLQKEVDALNSNSSLAAAAAAAASVSPKHVRRRSKKRRMRGRACINSKKRTGKTGDTYEEESSHSSEYENEDDGSVQSSFSYESNKSNNMNIENDSESIESATEEQSANENENSDEDYSDDEDYEQPLPAKKSKRNNGQDVIEIDLASDSDSDSGSDSTRSKGGDQNNKVNDDGSDSSQSSDQSHSDEGSVVADNNQANINHRTEDSDNDSGLPGDDSFFQSDYNCDDTEDEDDTSGDIERYYVSKIKQSKLSMAAQGFRVQAKGLRSPANEAGNNSASSTNDSAAKAKDHKTFDPCSIKFRGKTYHKNRCYITTTKEGDVIVGIQRFLSNDTAQCIMIQRFEDTILGIEDEGLEYEADPSMAGTHVQIYREIHSLSLSKLGRAAKNVKTIPRLIYQPQTPGDWHTFGYFYERNAMQRRGKRQGGMRSLEVFAGAGGSLLGYKNEGFDTAMAIENDKDAVCTLKGNNQDLKVYEGCIKKFIQDYNVLKCALGKIDNIHFSSPCQDFSKANRSQTTGKRERADLSLLLIDLIKLTSCSTAVFENVLGIWQRKNVHYMKNIAMEIFKLGYQVRCTVLHACDFGDPQRRPRFFMFISKNTVPLPSLPDKSHGDANASYLWPYVTIKEALSNVADDDTLPNLKGQTTQLQPGQHGLIRLKPYDVAPTIRAASVKPLHYKHDRCINVREAASIQSFPPWYVFHGSVVSQYRQVGNAVPVELSTAVARSIRQVLLYDYGEDGEEQ